MLDNTSSQGLVSVLSNQDRKGKSHRIREQIKHPSYRLPMKHFEILPLSDDEYLAILTA